MHRKRPTPEELTSVIRQKCMDCSGNSRRQVEQCEVTGCPLYPYRSRRAMGAEEDGRAEIRGQISLFDREGGESGCGRT